jgi:zona occludens toxin
MAINAYVGLQGSGKSFEVVSSVIVPAVEQGRRVVTNIAGISQERIHEYLSKKNGVPISTFGSVVHVPNDRILQPAFFPDEEKPEIDSLVKGGDLVAIDEAWRFWAADGGKLSHEHMQFFRMHRHYVHPDTAVACDVVVMTQDITGLHRSLKNVIEFTFRMQKHKSLGMTKRYRVDIFEGWKLNQRTRIDHQQKAYNPDIFPLYQSYAGGSGQETAIDKRQNILANKTLWLYVIGMIALLAVSGFFVYRFFNPSSKPNPQPSSSASSSPQPHQTFQPPQHIAQPTGEVPAISDAWRVVGYIQSGSDRWVVIADAAGRTRLESPSRFTGERSSLVGDIDGQRVTTWSGAAPRSVEPEGVQK